MPYNIKEYDGYLLDQLTLLERIENSLKKKSIDEALEQIEFERNAINRKLYRPVPPEAHD